MVKQSLILAALVAMPLACSALLGIEDAELVETTGSGGSGGAAGEAGDTTSNGGTGGSGGSGGTQGGSQNDTGAGGMADTGGSGGTAGATGEGDLCELYCDTVKANCQDDLAVYVNDAICLDLCATMDPGQPGDMEVDTVHCRLRQAELAALTGEPGVHCPVSGLGGSDICGNNCEALCRAMASTCPDEWASKTACLEDCEALEDLGGFNTGIKEGATVQCRLWHVGAATQDASLHCPHAAGAEPCGRAE